MSNIWPIELRLSPERQNMTILFDNGETRLLRAEDLRVHSPSAEVQGHNGIGGQVVVNKQQVRIDRIEPVGNYAVRLTFDDGHDTGLYTWDYLYALNSDRQ